MTGTRPLLLLGLLCLCPAVAFSASVASATSRRDSSSRLAAVSLGRSSPLFSSSASASASAAFLRLRGGQQDLSPESDDAPIEPRRATNEVDDDGEVNNDPIDRTREYDKEAVKGGMGLATVVAPVSSALRAFGTTYSSYLGTNPILTKSVTASAIFGLSDYAAQRLENKDSSETKSSINWTRTLSSVLVGLLYFGPAAHCWYETIFRVLPGTTLFSILQKAALGQLLFGPSFTCVFFASSLVQSGTFTLKNWVAKIKSDLPGAWAAGLGFWPFVDLVSYSVVPSRWIPLFVNFCSFVWTIYLSTVANRGSSSGGGSAGKASD